MQLRFPDPSLQKLSESSVRLDARFGSDDGSLVRQRICELMAADNLAIASTLPTLELRPLAGRTDDFAISVRPRLRMVFTIPRPAHGASASDEIDFASVETIHILAIEECDEP